MIAGTMRNSSAARIGSGVAGDVVFAHPFSVRWAQSVDDGEGAWIIYLPEEDLVQYAGAAVDVTGELTEAGGDYPEGWYRLSTLSAQSGGELYLVISPGEGTAAATAQFASSSSTAEGAVSIHVCTASVESETGIRRVRQYHEGVVVLGEARKTLSYYPSGAETPTEVKVVMSDDVEFPKSATEEEWTEIEVVTHLAYSPLTGKLTMSKKKIKCKVTQTSPTETTVFTAVPHIPG